MTNRWLWTFILMALSIAALFFNRGLVGLLAGLFFLVVLLFIWATPRRADKDDPQKTKANKSSMARSVLGVGLGLLAAVAAILLLPPWAFLALTVIVGIALIAWLIIQSRK